MVNDNFRSHLRIARGIAVVGAFILLTKVAAVAREIAIAWRYGVSETVDSFVFAFVMSTWLPGVWVAMLTVSYVPLVKGLAREHRQQFSSQLHGFSILLALICVLLVGVVLPPIVPFLTGGNLAESVELIKAACFTLAPVAGLGILIGFYSTLLLAEERHANSLAEAVPPLFVFTAVALLGLTQSLLILTIATVVGTAAQVGVLYYLLMRESAVPAVSLSLSSPAWLGFRQAMGALAISQIVMSLSLPIDQMLAARLDSGSLSTLGYASRILALALGLGSVAVSRAILPVLSSPEYTTTKRFSIARSWLLIMLALGGVGVFIGWFLSPFIVRLLFERGAFLPSDTIAVSHAVKFGLFQMPPFFAGIVAVQLFASLRLYKPIVISGLIAISVKLVLGYVMSTHFGLPGILISTALMSLASFGYLYWALVQRE